MTRGGAATKDDLIREFQAGLKGKDEEYVRALKKQVRGGGCSGV